MRSRSRPSFKAFILGAVLALMGVPGGAQDSVRTIEVSSPILIIDQDRLFAETALGTATLRNVDAQAKALAEENQTIEGELILEERRLTEQRPDLPTDEFRTLADEFDTRVQLIRAAQDEKARALTRLRDDARNGFFQDVAGIISDIVREKGAVVVIDRRDVFLSAERIDITEEAIRRVNAAEGLNEN